MLPSLSWSNAARAFSLLLCLGLIASVAHGQTADFRGIMTTISQSFTNPSSVAFDTHGNLYVANGSSVYEFQPVNGVIPDHAPSIVLGNGSLQQPNKLAVDSSGNVYITDGSLGVLELPATNGAVSPTTQPTVLNSSLTSCGAIAVDTSHNLYVSGCGNGTSIQELVAINGAVATTSPVVTITTGSSTPGQIVFDASGNLYFAEYVSGSVKEIQAVGGIIPQGATPAVVASGYQSWALAIDRSGNLFVADQPNEVLREYVAVNGVVPSSPTVKTYGANFYYPSNIALDASGNIFVADSFNNAVEEVTTTVNFGNVGVGTTGTTQSLIFAINSAASGITPDVLTQGASGQDYVNAGTGTCTPATFFGGAASCTVDVNFAPLHAGFHSGSVVLRNSSGTTIANAVVQGTAIGPQLIYPSGSISSLPIAAAWTAQGLATDGAGNVYVGAVSNNSLQLYSAASNSITSFGRGFGDTKGIAVDSKGNVFVLDNTNQQLVEIVAINGVVSTSSAINTIVNIGTPIGLAVDANDNLYITAGGSNNGVYEVAAGTNTLVQLGSGFNNPCGVAVDQYGNVYVADQNNNAIKEIVAVNGVIPANPTILTLGSGFSMPRALWLDGMGNLYVADQGNNQVKQIVAVNGVIPSTNQTINVLGSGFSSPEGVAVDPSGNVFVIDNGNLAIKEINLSTVPTLAFVTPTQVDTLDSTDGPQTMTLQNFGNAPLSLTSLSSGSNPSISTGFSVDSASTCTPTGAQVLLQAGASCTYVVDFTPTADGSITGALTLTDNNLTGYGGAAPTTQSFTLSGTGQGSPTITVSGAPSLVYSGVAENDTLTATGGYGPYSFVATGLPAGLSLSSAGVLTGTPTTGSGPYMVSITATDSSADSFTGTLNLTMTVSPVITVSAAITNGSYGVAFVPVPLSATGGTAPYTYSLASGSSLPPGLSVGIAFISGTPTTAGTYSFTLVATDANGYSGSQAYTVNIAKAALTVTPNTATMIYGGTVPTLSGTVSDNSDGITATYTTNATSTSEVTGTYHVRGHLQDPNGKLSNYAVTYTQAAFTITPAPLTVKPNAATMVYGGTVPTLSGTVSGVLNTDGITATYSTTATSTSAAGGTYQVTATLHDPNERLANYTVTNTPAAFTITGAPLTVTANAASMVYGGTVPTLSGTLLGVVNTDGITATYSTNATSTSAAGGTYSVTATLNDPNSKLANYIVTNTPAVFTVTSGKLTLSANSATKVYGTANPTFTGSVTGQVNGDTFVESFTTTATTTSAVGKYAIVPSVTGANLADYAQTVNNGTLTVTQAGSSTVLTTSSTSITPGQSVALTATVTSATSGTPTGTVSFYDGTTLLSAVAMTNGVATLNVTTLSAATTHSLTAVYSGDTNFTGSNGSAAVSITVAALDFTFTTGSGTTSQTVTAGSVATYTFQMAPLYGSYAGAVTFTASGLPTGAVATFTPSTVTAGSGSQTVTLSIQTAAKTASLERHGKLLGETLALLVLPMLGMRRRKGLVRLVCVLMCMAGAAAMLTGCGTSGQGSSSTPQTYTVAITATAGTLQHTSNVTLIVQ